MNFARAFFLRWSRLSLPGALLLTLLQRTPLLRVAAAAAGPQALAPVAAVLRAACTGVASLGAVHALAGATQFSFSRAQPVVGTVGTAIVPFAFTVIGAQTPAGSFRVQNLPPGLTVTGLNANSIVNASTGIISGTPTAAGTFAVAITAYEFNNALGDRFGPTTVTFTIAPGAAVAPTFTLQPASQSAAVGSAVTFAVAVTGNPAPTLQWLRNGTNLPGATGTTLQLLNLQAADAGDYSVVATNSAGTVPSNAATLTVTGAAGNSRLVNLSILSDVAAAGDSFTMGYVVGGAGTSGTKPILIRAAGPSLAQLGVTGFLANPMLELFAGATRTGENDNWGGSAALAAAFSAVGAFPYINNASLDAAALVSVTAGDNSARISASGAGTGTVIAELYDSTPAAALTPSTPRLVNVSVLKHLGSALTVGFVVDGTTPKTVLVRAIGPTIGVAPFNVPGVVLDPQMTLFAGQAVLSSNDNWGGTTALTAAFGRVGAFALPAASRDAALLATLQPGSYTVRVTGTAGTTGVALVEVYEVP